MNLRIDRIVISAFVIVAVACSSSTPSPAPDYTGSCRELASQCHGVKTPLGDECHDLGHDGDDAKCGPRKAECLAACPEGAKGDGGGSEPSDVDAGGGETDAATDAPADPCPVYCACMLSTCASEFADEAACLSACAAFSAKDYACYAKHCEDAKTAADPSHDCEHASGAVACH
ncbi:MAG: hypothetical protein KF764_30615 [Labilithrix sp.]|nr:hypothetical protein [Labilithrix sp.]MBX3220130.1 hypothetical protein [Labilithrix sp.]